MSAAEIITRRHILNDGSEWVVEVPVRPAYAQLVAQGATALWEEPEFRTFIMTTARQLEDGERVDSHGRPFKVVWAVSRDEQHAQMVAPVRRIADGSPEWWSLMERMYGKAGAQKRWAAKQAQAAQPMAAE